VLGIGWDRCPLEPEQSQVARALSSEQEDLHEGGREIDHELIVLRRAAGLASLGCLLRGALAVGIAGIFAVASHWSPARSLALLAPPFLVGGHVLLPACQELPQPAPDGILVGEKGAPVSALQVGEDLLGIDGCGELGAPAALPFGRCSSRSRQCGDGP